MVAVYEVKTWLKQLVCTWIQSSSGWIQFLSCSFSVLEADLLSGGFASKSPVSAGSIEHRSGCWALLTAAGRQLWHGQGGLSLRAVSWQWDLPAQLVFLPSQGGYFPCSLQIQHSFVMALNQVESTSFLILANPHTGMINADQSVV